MKLLSAMNISASGMTSERLRFDLIATNLANLNTTRTSEGGPYRRQIPIFAERLAEARRSQEGYRGTGVEVVGIIKEKTSPRLVYDPSHPDANGEGYVALPNINVTQEMVNMLTASRSYEANVTTFNAAKQLAIKALEIGRG